MDKSLRWFASCLQAGKQPGGRAKQTEMVMKFMKRTDSGGQRQAIVVDKEAAARAFPCQSQNPQIICAAYA